MSDALVCTTGRCPRLCCCTVHHWTLSTCLLLHCAPLDVLHVSVAALCATGRSTRVCCCTMYYPGRCHVSVAVLCTTGRSTRVCCYTVHHWMFYTCSTRVYCCTVHHWMLPTCLLLYCVTLDVVHVSIAIPCTTLDVVTCLLLYHVPPCTLQTDQCLRRVPAT